MSNSKNGEVSIETVFHYRQEGELVSATYKGGSVMSGSIVGLWRESEQLDLLYHCLTNEGELKAGKAQALASVMDNGKIKLSLDWQWLTSDQSSGKSEYVEID
ncbi:MAG: n-acetylglutamate synthase [Cyclobacteriaceae bacterium]